MRAVALFPFACCNGASVPNIVAVWDVPKVATLNIAKDLPGLPGASLIGTTFGPFGKDEVFAVSLADPATANVSTLSTAFHWPNEAYQLPANVKSKADLVGEHLVIADGFLFPGKQTGGIHLLELKDDLTTVKKTITAKKHAWFYHHSEWMDVDQDGLLDVVAARSTKPLAPWFKTDTELVWVRNAGNGEWGETQVITKGPGVGFFIADVDGDDKMEIVATEFFARQQLSIYSCLSPTWADCAAQQANVVESVVDVGDGPFFQASWVDLNGDGRKDILATAQQQTVDGNVIPGKVLAFECPANWTAQAGTANWTRHVLADGYLPYPKQSAGSGAPGVATAFIMDDRVGGKPHVVLSSDDGGLVDLLTPTSQAPEDWSYNKDTLYKSSGEIQGMSTIGTVLVADVDSSGRPELFIPSYAESKLLMYTFDHPSTMVV